MATKMAKCFICPCHLSVHQYSAMGASCVYQTSTANVRGPVGGVLWAMEMGAMQLLLVLSSYIQESIAVMWQSFQLSMYVYSCLPCLNTWCGRSLCSKCMWHHVCVWFSLSSWFLCYTIVSLHCSVSCSDSPHNVLHSTTCICLCMVVYYLKPPCTN